MVGYGEKIQSHSFSLNDCFFYTEASIGKCGMAMKIACHNKPSKE
jgi:hypothetical protein